MARLSFLASDVVTPVGGAPVLVSPDQHYSRVAVLRTQAANGKHYTVLFLLSGMTLCCATRQFTRQFVFLSSILKKLVRGSSHFPDSWLAQALTNAPEN